MIVSSLKINGFSCFKTGWNGFDEFKPINLIIGRNNTGKSRLIELVELLTKTQLSAVDFETNCTAKLDQSFLGSIFPENTSGGALSPSGQSHWSTHGKPSIGKTVSWTRRENNVEFRDPFSLGPYNYSQKATQVLRNNLHTWQSPFFKRSFRRILADRDIRPESANEILQLSFDGAGATNVIRKYITSSSLSEDLIQVELLRSLSEIFGSDANFTRIEIRQHDGGGQTKQWEVYLGEPEKATGGLVSLSSSGSGLKTAILVLLNLLVVPKMEQTSNDNYIFAFEELENNLHPALLRRLLRYVSEYVAKWKCIVFITTHSNVALDYFASNSDAQIFHVKHNGSSASIQTISAHFDQVELISELGARPSDLLQANGILWLEGPSDRTYLNRFIDLYSNGELIEGRDYQCAFYGGSVLSRCQLSPPETERDELLNLLRLNNNVAIVCDGDRLTEESELKPRVQRIESEVRQIPRAFIWVTQAKELENYIPGIVWSAVYKQPDVPDPDTYDRFPSKNLTDENFVTKHLKRTSFDKCDFASEAAPMLTKLHLDSRFDLAIKIQELVVTIRSWNK